MEVGRKMAIYANLRPAFDGCFAGGFMVGEVQVESSGFFNVTF
jgi:hypothetical protein